VQRLIPPIGCSIFPRCRSSAAWIFADDNFARICLLVIQFTEKDGAFVFAVRVIPKSSKSEIVGEIDGALKVKINAPPIDGAANAELIKFWRSISAWQKARLKFSKVKLLKPNK
jgi:uncharacterized protein (TIGR00251 family)